MRFKCSQDFVCFSLSSLALLAGLIFLLASPVIVVAQSDELLSRIAFGSCLKQDRPQPIWNNIAAWQPEVFLFIGDNIYGDTEDMEIMQLKWNMLGNNPGFQKLRKQCKILATWDDHDYGANDGGVEFPMKVASQKVFLDFFEEPADSPRRKRAGIYDAKVFGPAGQRIQIILLDTRYFRSPLVPSGKTYSFGSGVHGPYAANDDPDATILGEAQWKWLEEQLKAPAELRIIASSIQVISNEHWWEKWGNFPRERERLFDLIETKANGVIFISGDRHRAEVSRFNGKLGYPIYDITSSSLNQPQKWRNELNEYRVGTLYCEINFGTILVDWSQQDPTVTMEIRDGEAKSMIEVQRRLSELRPKN